MTHTETDEKPKFDLATRQFSDEEFKKHISFLKLKIQFDEEFNILDTARLATAGIVLYKDLFSCEIPPDVNKKLLENRYFSFPIKTPVVFTPEQIKQLK